MIDDIFKINLNTTNIARIELGSMHLSHKSLDGSNYLKKFKFFEIENVSFGSERTRLNAINERKIP